MVSWLGILLGTLRSTVRTHRELALENLALRQQLAVWTARQPRPRLTEMDRVFWVLLSRLWTSWRHSLEVVRPETVVGWHRQGFTRYCAHFGHRDQRDRRIVIGAKRRGAVGQLSSLASFLREGPFSTSRCALWRRRSQIASASVASPMCSCHWAGGSWLVTIVERVP